MKKKSKKKQDLIQAIKKIEETEYGIMELIQGLAIGIIIGFVIAMLI